MDGLKARLSFDAVAYDYDDEYLTIDTDTHTININNVSRLFGVQYDGNSKLIKFRIRNQLSDIQKMQDSIVYINWIDSRGVKGQSIAINKTINNDTCEFAWKVPFDALKNSGVLHFAMSAVVTKNSSSVIDQRWSTQIASVITPDGIYIKSYTPSSEEEDRIAQIYNELSNMINKQNDNLSDMQSQVNLLKEELTNNFKIDSNVKLTLTSGQYINAINNAIATNSAFSTTNPIAVKKGQTVVLTATGERNVVGMIAICDASNTSRQVISTSIDSNEHDYIYKVQKDGYIVCSFNHNHPYKLSLNINYYSSIYNTVDTLIPVNKGTEPTSIIALSTGYINATNNQYTQSDNFNVSDSINLYKGQTVKLTAKGYNTIIGMINLYDDDNDTYKTVVPSADGAERVYTYTATEDCIVRFSYAISSPASATITTNETGFIRINNIEKAISDLQGGDNYPIEYPIMFTNVICIGDSLTYGHDGQKILTENYPFYFSKLAGVTISNKGLSSRTAKQWWDEVGNSFEHFADYDCAIIYLGTNGGLTDTVSTDCNSDYTKNADTNTGCYGKIIGKIKADAPNCKIFCVAGVTEYIKRRTTMNPAVRALAKFYDVGLIDIENCILADNGSPTTEQRYRYRPYDGIHYNKLGYFTFASMIYDYMNKYIENHLNKF